MRIGSLFSGIGGLELGLERAGVGHVVWQCEIDPFCRAVLAKNWPHVVSRYTDVRTLSPENDPILYADLICGGFPCQDLSDAHTAGGRGAGLDGPKSGLWFELLRVIVNTAPRWIVVENIMPCERWLPRVRGDLHERGYSCVPLLVRASDVGAPHERPRCFAIAHTNGEGQPLRAVDVEVAGVRALSEARRDWGTAPPGGFRVADGVPSGVDRNRALGNAVVAACAEVVGRVIVALDAEKGSAGSATNTEGKDQ